MASIYLPLPTIPDFSGDNYDFWATKMQHFLVASDLWDLVDKGFEAPVANEQQKIFQENLSKDRRALLILQSVVSDKIFPYIMKATTAKEAWTILHKENQDTRKKEAIDWMEAMRAMQHHSGEICNISNKSIVPDKLREANENSYEPKFVSIGPRVRGSRRGPLKMEGIKWQCMSSLLYRLVLANAESNLAECGQFILRQNEVLESYAADHTPMKLREIANIVLYDACFVLELLNGGLAGMFYNSLSGQERDKVSSDLLVLDNQIPFFILRKLYRELFGNRDDLMEVKALQYLFGYIGGPSQETNFDSNNFVELVHSYISVHLEGCQESRQYNVKIREERNLVRLDRCASTLRAAGVKIALGYSNFPVGVLDFRIRFDRNSGTLHIPRLDITETTKARWQNLIAWELHQMKTSETLICKCTSAALAFNTLICCESDVQLLKDIEIIKDYPEKSNKDLVTFFRSIIGGINQDEIDPRYNTYYFDDLNKYYRYPTRHVTLFPLRFWHYLTGAPREALRDLHNYLKQGYRYVAVLVTIMTLLQGVYAVLSYHHPKK